MRIRTGHYPGQWLDLGPGSAFMSGHVGGSAIVAQEVTRTICGMPLASGGGCARYNGHMGPHASRAAMDRQNEKGKAA